MLKAAEVLVLEKDLNEAEIHSLTAFHPDRSTDWSTIHDRPLNHVKRYYQADGLMKAAVNSWSGGC